jgi:hypothetical protein
MRMATPEMDEDSAVVADLDALLRRLGLADLQELEDYCEDEMCFLATVWTDEFDEDAITLFISPVGSLVATGLTFPFTMGFLRETLVDIEEDFIGFA